jgi:hypothetical protein
MNYLLNFLEDYFNEILRIEGNLIVTEVFLKNHKEYQVLRDPENRQLISAITSYRDLSFPKGQNNLFSPRFSFSLTVDELERRIEDIISQQACMSIAQGYEAFESFLINILVEVLNRHPEKAVKLNVIEEGTVLTRSELKKLVRSKQGTNNKGLLGFVRRLSAHFREYERNNIFEVNFSEWFDMISMVRHILVHERQKISDGLLDYLKTKKVNEMFERHFTRRKIEADVHISLNRHSASDILNWMNSFAHFIFKGLSIECKLESIVPQYC